MNDKIETNLIAEPTTSLEAPVVLDRSLGRWQLTLIGVSNAVGAGVLVLAGTMAANYAGPAAALSFVIAGFVCLLVALCYAELAAMMPEAGSAYSYAKISSGRFVSWLVGWCLVLGYLVAGSTVAVGWSGYLMAFLEPFGLEIPQQFLGSPIRVSPDFEVTASGQLFNAPAVAIVLLCTLTLLRGIRGSAALNTFMVGLKLIAIIAFIGFGAFYIDPDNWVPFIPPGETDPNRYGVAGVLAGAVLAFYAFTGFEVISTSTQEAKRPERDIPFALIASFCICAVLYVTTTLVMTGMVNYSLLNHPSPMTLAIDSAGPQLAWLGLVVSALIVVGLPSAVLVSLYGQTRIFVVMSSDKLLPPLFGRISPRFRTPIAGTWIVGAAAALIAGVLPLEVLGELVSMGLLFCFTIVCGSVIILRRRTPEMQRPFKVPFYPLTPALGVVSCLYLIFTLPIGTWSRLAIWLAIGIVIYIVSARRIAETTQERS
jgi:basic amino acid/polyamine antiporter, APA family